MLLIRRGKYSKRNQNDHCHRHQTASIFLKTIQFEILKSSLTWMHATIITTLCVVHVAQVETLELEVVEICKYVYFIKVNRLSSTASENWTIRIQETASGIMIKKRQLRLVELRLPTQFYHISSRRSISHYNM